MTADTFSELDCSSKKRTAIGH